MYVIRLATLSDIEALHNFDGWPKRRDWERQIDAQQVFVLEVDGEIGGLLRFDVLWTTVPFLALIFINAPLRGRGYSRQMLKALCAHLKNQGYVALLSSSQTDEPEAQKWHRHMGFHSNGIIENIAEEGVGELVFRLVL